MSKLPSKPRQSLIDPETPKAAFGARTVPGRAATKEETQAAGSGAELPSNLRNAGAALSRAGIRDVMSNEQARALAERMNRGVGPTRMQGGAAMGPPDPRNSTLPAVISTDLEASKAGFNPKWHMVRNLPGYYQEAIRGYGRSIFQSFTSAPLEDIQTVTTLSNSETEVKLLMAWIKENGVREDVVEFDGSQVFNSYKADIQKWSCMDFSFLLVRDPAGHYVYGWHRDFDNSIDNEPQPCFPGR